jgi:hypothetical protein
MEWWSGGVMRLGGLRSLAAAGRGPTSKVKRPTAAVLN